MATLKIQSRDNRGFLDVSLDDVLQEIGEDGQRFNWYIYWLEGTANPDSGLDIVQLEEDVRNSPTGKMVSWEELNSLASRIYQVTEGLFVATQPGENPRARSDVEQHKGAAIILELDDSSRWLISAQAQEMVDSLRRSLIRSTDTA